MNNQSFLNYVYNDLRKKYSELSELAIVFPNRRSIVYFNNEISKNIDKPIFAPFLSSVEDFFFEIINYKKIDSLTLFFEFYEEYVEIY